MDNSFPVLTFPALLKRSAELFSNRPAGAFVADTPITYHDFYERVQAVTAMLEKVGVESGEKVAILSANGPNWGVTYFAITFMGAVVVPLLPDFNEKEIRNVLEHSEAKVLFISRALIPKVEKLKLNSLKTRIHIEDYSVCKGKEVMFDLSRKPKKEYHVTEDMLAAIIYTSGTTGKSKGVMLTHKNICSNAVASRSVQEILPEDRFLSILPLSHTYENTIGFVLPFISGASIYYLRKLPTPAVLLPALNLVKPTMMLSVPLIIEKIYRSKILPTFNEKKIVSTLYKKALFRKMLNRLAGKKLRALFGGQLKFFGIGGAKLDGEVEAFLREAKFPYAIGYGLTETSPLLAGVNPLKTKLQSTGPALEGVTLKINNPDPKTGEGEIWAKGPNVMMGYYKEPKITKEVLTEDGWFKTGDLGFLDDDGFLFIRGRSKNVIVGASGENIFPEDIESVINNFPHVQESLVVQIAGKLVALVHFNREEVELKYNEMKEKVADFSDFIENKFEEMKKEVRDYVNSKVNRFSKINEVKLQEEEFIKTATKKIKRFLYTGPDSKKTA